MIFQFGSLIYLNLVEAIVLTLSKIKVGFEGYYFHHLVFAAAQSLVIYSFY